MTWSASASVYTQLHEFAKTTLLKILVDPYATVCDLYCGCGVDTEKWAQAQIGQYFGIDLSESALNEAREEWECHRRPYPAEFYELDPCAPNLASSLPDKCILTDIVCCLRNLQDCFASEDQARNLLQNVASLLKPGGYFFGITADSSTIWSRYQKAVEVKRGSLKVNGMLPHVRTEQYTITFEDDRFTPFGMKYHLQFSDGLPPQTQLLVHFPSLIRLATEVGLEYIEIQNMADFYDDHRYQFQDILQETCGSIPDIYENRITRRLYDVLSLFTTFIFRKLDYYTSGSTSSPSFNTDERMHPLCSDLTVDNCSEAVADGVHDTQSLFDSRDQSQQSQCHSSEVASNEPLMPCDSYSHPSNSRSPCDGNSHGDLEICQRKCDNADKLVGLLCCEKPGSSEKEILTHDDLSPPKEICDTAENGKGEQNYSTHTHVRFNLSESHGDHIENVSPEKASVLETENEKKTVELKYYSRSNGNTRKYLNGKLHTSVSKSQEHETANQHINSEKSQQGYYLHHLKWQKKVVSEMRPSNISGDMEDSLTGSHHTCIHDNKSGYDEGEHGSFDERHHSSGSHVKDGGNPPSSACHARVDEKNTDQKRCTEVVNEHCDIESKKQKFPSIMDPQPAELRLEQPADIQHEINDQR